jgi:hypothetical protein
MTFIAFVTIYSLDMYNHLLCGLQFFVVLVLCLVPPKCPLVVGLLYHMYFVVQFNNLFNSSVTLDLHFLFIVQIISQYLLL